MFNLEESIKNWLTSFYRFNAFQHGSIEEMEQHLRDHIEDLIDDGLSEQEAFDKATKSFGSAESIAIDQHKSNKPIHNSHSAMYLNYLKIAVRSFSKHKSYATLNILGLTMGLIIVLLIGLFVSDELSFDQFHKKKDQLFRVVENQHYAGQPLFPVAVTPTALGPALESEYPEVLNFMRYTQNSYVFRQGENKITENGGIMADGSLFEMFSFELLDGDISSFSENLNGLVLNENLAEKYFPNGTPVGKEIELDGENYEVLAVAKNVHGNSHIEFDYVTNFEKYLQEDTSRASNWASNWLYTYVELDPQADLSNLNDKIIGLIKTNLSKSVSDIYLQPLLDVYLGEVDFTAEVSTKGEMMYVKIFTIVAIFILLISCINFMNLSTARSAKRAKEVGLRKTVGASRRELILQFLSESMIMAFFASILAVAIVIILLPVFNQITGKSFDLAYIFSLENGMRLVVVVVASALLTGLLSGIYPAFVLSNIQPLRTLNKYASGRRGEWLRKALVIFQFTISVILITGTWVVYSQFSFIQNVDLGYDKDHVIYMFVNDQRKVFAEEVRKISGVENVGLSNRHPGYVMSSTSAFDWPGKNPDESILMHFMGVDENYIPTMKLRINEGRNFLALDSTTVMINERAKELMGIKNPIGQTITAYGERKIVGVVDDFNFKSIHNKIEPIVIFKLDAPPRAYIKYDPRQEEKIQSEIEQVWNRMYPNQEFNPYFLDRDFNEMYEAEKRTGSLSTYFAILAIFVSCLGLYGLVAYAVEQRKKEIGIRKVMGASVSRLFLLLSTDFTRLVIFSLILALPIGWVVMDQWLDNFAYRINLSIWVFLSSGAVTIVLAIATVSYQTLKASYDNPVNSLRDD